MLIQKFANLNLSTETSFKKVAHCGYSIAFRINVDASSNDITFGGPIICAGIIHNVILFIDTSNNEWYN